MCEKVGKKLSGVENACRECEKTALRRRLEDLAASPAAVVADEHFGALAAKMVDGGDGESRAAAETPEAR